MELEGADGRDDDRGVGLHAGGAALDVPELLEADVGGESALRDEDLAEAAREAVGDHRALADRDVGERAGVDEDRLALERLHERRVHGADHPRGHRAVDLEVARGDGRAGARPRHDDAAHALAQVREVARDGEDGHDLGRDGDVEAAVHLVAVHLAAAADLDVAQRLRAEVDRPAHVDAGRVDVEAPEVARGELVVVVVALVLHARGEGGHAEVVRVGDRVDVAREAERERREREALGEAAAGGGALDVERRAAGGLADRGDGVAAEDAEALDEAHRRRRLALAERGRGHRGDVDVLGARGVGGRAGDDALRVDLAVAAAVGGELVGTDPEGGGDVGDGPEFGFGGFGDLPVGEFGGVEFHGCSVVVFNTEPHGAAGVAERWLKVVVGLWAGKEVGMFLWFLNTEPHGAAGEAERWLKVVVGSMAGFQKVSFLGGMKNREWREAFGRVLSAFCVALC